MNPQGYENSVKYFWSDSEKMPFRDYKMDEMKVSIQRTKWSDILCSSIGRQYCQDVSSSQVDTLCQCNPTIISGNYFVDVDKLILKFFGEVNTHIS